MKDIPNYEGKYAIDESGNVWSYKSNRYLKQIPNNSGYMRVFLYNTNIHKAEQFYIHRLVAITYIENPDKLSTVHHIDHNRRNNSLSNLQWLSRSDNSKDNKKKKEVK